MKKNLSILSVILLIPFLTFGQNLFSETDLQGEWEHSRGYIIKIENSQAKISRIKDPFPEKVIGETFYSNIIYIGDGVWKAKNRIWQWRVNDIINGWWKDMGEVTIKLSSDKMTLSDGARSLNRLESKEGNEIVDIANSLEPNSKKVYNSNYGELALEYTIGKTSSGKNLVFVKGINNYEEVIALVKFESDGKVLFEEKINPREGFSAPIPSTQAIVTVTFEAYKPGNSSPDLIQILRKKFEEEFKIKDNDLKLEKKNYTGVRG